MVVCNFNIDEIVPFHTKTDTILIVDTNAVLSFPVAPKGFQMIRRRDAQVLQIPSIVDHNQLPQGDPLNGLRKFF